ncbi:putative Restriction modification system DNA specificity domain protein [Thiocapsa sp. KS1]|nr:restriction endonuclease subunit S [Thiocapsa sp. KS1]CRI67281.1 putative Restriction modification system DNA specificity domain protein [Thiocapsa sp. KS1]
MRRPLRDLADVHYGRSPNEVVHENGSIPVVGTGGVYGRAVRPLFQGPAIVVPRKGSLGNPQYISSPFWAVDTTYAVLPKKGVHARWLHYSLAHFDLTKLNEATGVPSISRDWLFKILFEDPGEKAQSRIAEILSTVDEAIEQTEALIAKTQQIKAGLMHDLFTRGVTADGQLRPPREEAPQLYKESPLGWIPKGWKISNLGAEITGIDSGWSPNCENASASFGEWAVLKTTAVVWDGYNPTENKSLSPATAHYPRITVKPGDILITRKGPVDRVGVAVHVAATPSSLMFPDTVFRTRLLPKSEFSPVFLAFELSCRSVQKFWWARKVGLADAQVNLNHSILKRTPLACPDTNEQNAICARQHEISEAISALSMDLEKLELVKAGLMQDLLTGRVPITLGAQPEATEVAASV